MAELYNVYDPTAGLALGQAQGPTAWYNNKNFWQALAGIGGALDPQGFGGQSAKVASGLISSMAAQERAAKQATAQNAQTAMVIDALNRYGGISPKEIRGVTSIDTTPEGVKLEITPAAGDTPMAPSGSGTSLYNNVTPPPAAPIDPNATGSVEESRRRISAIRPFFLAPLA